MTEKASVMIVANHAAPSCGFFFVCCSSVKAFNAQGP